MMWLGKYSESQKPMDLGLLLRFSAFDIVSDVVLSRNLGLTREGKDHHKIVMTSKWMSFSIVLGHYRFLANLLFTNPFMTWLGILPFGFMFHTAMNVMKEREKIEGTRSDVASHWFKVMREQPGRLSIRNIQAQAVNCMNAGSDTVGGAMQGFVYHMIRSPEALVQVQEEMRAAIDQGLCRTTVVTYADAQKLPYFQSCIKETLRFFTPVPFSLPRVAPQGGITIGDHHFEQGTILSVNPWVIHQSEEIWGPDARKFNPERWFRQDVLDLEKKYFIPVRGIYAYSVE